MSEIQMAHFSFSGESADRSRIHDVALRDARVATDHREAAVADRRPKLAARLGLGARLRVAFAGPVPTEPCNCPA